MAKQETWVEREIRKMGGLKPKPWSAREIREHEELVREINSPGYEERSIAHFAKPDSSVNIVKQIRREMEAAEDRARRAQNRQRRKSRPRRD